MLQMPHARDSTQTLKWHVLTGLLSEPALLALQMLGYEAKSNPEWTGGVCLLKAGGHPCS